MRLAAVDDALPLRLRVAGLMFGVKYLVKRRERPESWQPPDVMKALVYRSDFYGKPASRAAQRVMRGKDSEWSVGERELFGAFVSSLNQCPF